MTASKQQDRLGDILNAPTNDAFHGVAELNLLIQSFGRGVKERHDPVVRHGATGAAGRKPHGVPKKKTTHYLPQEMFEELGDAKERIRDLVPEAVRGLVSKSGIINQALLKVLEEFEANGRNSELVRRIIASGKPKI
ncbi:MAG: hypothetical protein COZ12_00825 [Deltaproteobacteria bacterium CG_4_10_14_3_um_filter_60_8]|nr:MAG: hypothetical protein AUK28_04015 [Desulfobacterales bacterium CG2_30_60_27]PIY24702.1 MAG: hypothetical protein COZ12_00825 [Deltaproteobacteria bacterium CG_4_10_14_3_um_filter_60_8]